MVTLIGKTVNREGTGGISMMDAIDGQSAFHTIVNLSEV